MKSNKLHFLTEYKVNDRLYGADLWATTAKEADRMAKERNIGEIIISNGRKTGGLKRSLTKVDKAHEAAFLGWIAIEMGIHTPMEILGDMGIVHELIHNINSPVKGLDKRLKELREAIPGHLR